jgi:predicted MFS family arabinose efflux permease
VEWSAFREAPYTLYLIGSFLYFWSVYVGWFFIGTFARNVLGASQATSINLLMVLNGVGIVGRMLPAYVAQRWFGGLNVMIPFAAAAGVILYCWIAVDSITGLWIFAVLYGVVAHGLQSLFPVVLASLTTDPTKAGVRNGMGFSIMVSCPALQQE